MGDIGNKIRLLRESKGMTQEELAHKVGYKSRASINKIELQRDIPLKKLAPIAAALGISPSELAGWEKEEKTVPKYVPGTVEIIDLYSRISPEQREIVLNLLRSMISD